MASQHNLRVLLLGLAVSLLVVIPVVALAEDEVASQPLAVIVHKSSPVESIAISDLRKMLTGALRTWPDSPTVVLVQQPDTSPSQKRMLQLVLKTNPAAYNRSLLRAQFQGGQVPTIKVINSDTNAIAFVWNVPGALSLVDPTMAAASSHVKVLKVDGKLPSEPGYALR